MRTTSIKHALFALLLVTIAGCSSEGEAPVPASFDGEKLLAQAEYPDRLLTKTAVAVAAGQQEEKISLRRHSSAVPAYGIIATYSWPTGNEQSIIDIKGQKLAIPGYASVAVGLIRPADAAFFRAWHNGNAGMQAEADALARDSAITAAIGLQELRYLDGYAKSRSIAAVRNVGELAYWEMPAQALHVLADGSSFTVIASVEDNEAANRRMAIQVAAQVLSSKL